MNTTHDHAHYTPSSVGALMDPVFLRKAAHDAQALGYADDSAQAAHPARWRTAFAEACERLGMRLRAVAGRHS